jgi:hypothetical protein
MRRELTGFPARSWCFHLHFGPLAIGIACELIKPQTGSSRQRHFLDEAGGAGAAGFGGGEEC